MDPPPDQRRQRSKGTGPAGAVVAEGPATGRVFFVGAGPGGRHLLTLRAADLLAEADVIVHDRLVHSSVLELAGSQARLIPAPADTSEPAETLEPAEATPSDAPSAPVCKGRAIGERLVSLSREAATIVRLKGGDPTIFARLAEEIEPLGRAGVPWEVVPGITAAAAAAAAARIPLTSRSSSSSLTLLTGHEALGKRSDGSLALLAAAGGTLVIYMGVERAEEWSMALVEAGRPADARVAVVSRCGCPEERILHTTLGEVPRALASVEAPAVAVVGDVVAEGPPFDDAVLQGPRAASGAECRPDGPERRAAAGLAGLRILLPRPEGSASELSERLRGLGAECLEIPVIRIEPPASWQPLDDAIRSADRQDWIVFASVHGVRAFTERMRLLRRDGRHLGTVRLAAVGQTTAAALLACGLVCDLAPREHASAEALADRLLAADGAAPRSRFLLVRADRGRDVLRARLEAAGHSVSEVCGYRSVDVVALSPQDARALEERPVAWVVLTSPSVARGVARLFPPRHLAWARVASISPLTSAAAREVGIRPDVEAVTPSAGAILESILAAESRGR